MRFYFILSLLVVLVSCSDSAENELVGKWKYSRLEKNKTLFLSDDPAELNKIIDARVRENDKYMKNVSKFRENAEEEMAILLNIFFEFKTDSTMLIIDETQGYPVEEKWDYLIDSEEKKIKLMEGDRTVEYEYKVKKDKLFLYGDDYLEIVLTKQEK